MVQNIRFRKNGYKNLKLKKISAYIVRIANPESHYVQHDVKRLLSTEKICMSGKTKLTEKYPAMSQSPMVQKNMYE